MEKGISFITSTPPPKLNHVQTFGKLNINQLNSVLIHRNAAQTDYLVYNVLLYLFIQKQTEARDGMQYEFQSACSEAQILSHSSASCCF